MKAAAGPATGTTGLGRGSRWPLLVAALGSGVCVLVWSGAAVLTASHGFDVTDESFYLLSYRWWDSNFYSATGVQYVLGPVFQLLGNDIAALRLVRLGALVLAHAVFGWQFMRWLRARRPGAPTSRWWEAAGTAAITACAGIMYSWLPLSPGYNDVTLVGTVLAAAATVRILRAADADELPPRTVLLALGAIAVMMLLAKWSSGLLVFLCVGAVLLTGLARLGVRTLLVAVATSLVGAAATALLVQVLVPLQEILPPMIAVNALVAESSNSPGELLGFYGSTSFLLGDDIVRHHWTLLLAAALTAAGRWLPRTMTVVGLLAFGYAGWQAYSQNELVAGSDNLSFLAISMFAPLVAVAVVVVSNASSVLAAVRLRQGQVGRARRWVVYALLMVLPVAQAAGTNNTLHYLAMLGLGLWMAVVIAVLTALPADELAPRVMVAAAAAALVASSTLVAVDGLWNRPYRTPGHSATTTVAAGVPALSSVRLDPQTAAGFSALRARLAPVVEEPGRAMMVFDDFPGLIYLLDGRPVGEAWSLETEPERSAASIRRVCAGGPWWGERLPVVVLTHEIEDVVGAALTSCGLALDEDYERLEQTVTRPDTGAPVDLEILVPAVPGR